MIGDGRITQLDPTTVIAVGAYLDGAAPDAAGVETLISDAFDEVVRTSTTPLSLTEKRSRTGTESADPPLTIEVDRAAVADIDGNGFIDFRDGLAWMRLRTDGDDRADVDGDGQVTFVDARIVLDAINKNELAIAP